MQKTLHRALSSLGFMSLLLFSVPGKSQAPSVPISDALKAVTQTFGTHFLYEKSLLENKTTTYNIHKLQGKKVEEVLKSILYPKDLVFLYVKENYYTIISKAQLNEQTAAHSGRSEGMNTKTDPAASAMPRQQSDQKNQRGTLVNNSGVHPVHGTITDSLGNPLTGAVVRVRGTNKGTITDVNGYYSVDAKKGDLLSFSLLGYQPRTAEVGDNDVIRIVLHAASSTLGEVVISTGYQYIRKEQSTGATSTITTKDYESRISTDILQGLQNRLPGILINNDITYQNNPLFQIRGIATITANSNPLIVVDGFPTELPLSAINPNEIKSITLLKDAAAAAIYGVRASNGVIIIERKHGTPGKPNFEFRTTIGITGKENYNKYRYGPGSIVINYDRLTFDDGIDMEDYANMSLSGVYQFTPDMDIIFQKAIGKMTQDQMVSKLNQLAAYNNASDYSKFFTRTALTQQYDLNMSGGNDRASYYISANYLGNKFAKVKNTENNIMVSARGTYKISDRLNADFNMDYSENTVNSVPVPDFGQFYPYERFQDADGNPLATFQGSYTNPHFNQMMLDKKMGFEDNMYYPLDEINHVTDTKKSFYNKIYGNLTYRFSPSLNFRIGGIYERSISTDKHYADEKSAEARQLVNEYIEISPDDPNTAIFNIPKGGVLKTNDLSMNSFTVRGQFNFDNTFNDKHEVSLMAGGEIRKLVNSGHLSSGFGYSDQTLIQQPVDLNKILTGYWYSDYYVNSTFNSFSDLFNESYTDDRFLSLYGNGIYTFDKRYSLSGSLRIDQANLFGTDPKFRYKPLWSIGFAWNAKNEFFLKNVDFVSAAKLRLAYGFNGNLSKNSIPRIVGQYSINIRTIPSSTAISLLSLQNNSLRWEQTRNTNIGIDLTFLNRINLTLDYYRKEGIDLLGNTLIDPTRGSIKAVINNASVSNKGIELNLNADWIQHPRRRFNWNSGLVISRNVNKVISLYQNIANDSRDYVDADYLVGYPINPVFSYRYAGLDSSGNPLVYDEAGKKKLITNSNNAGIKDLKYCGPGIPTITAGLSNRIDIGPFYFFCMIDFTGGFKVRGTMPSPYANRPLKGSENYFKKAGDEKKTDIMGISDFNYNYSYYSYAIYAHPDKMTLNGSYFVLRDITASYSLNSKIANHMGFSHIEFKVQASNIYTMALNRYNYSIATGNFARRFLVPTFTFGVFTNF